MSQMSSSSGSEILSTSYESIKRFISLVRGNAVSGIRENIDTKRISLIKLQDRKDKLKLCESNLKNKLYASIDQKEIELRYGADVKQLVADNQSLEKMRSSDNPDPNIIFCRNKLREEVPGFKEIESELNAIDSEIKDVNLLIKLYEEDIKEFEEENKPELSVDIEKDRISKSVLSYLFYLKNLSENFIKLTTDENGNRKYNTGSNDNKKLSSLREIFKANIPSIGKIDPQYINGDKKMNLEDIGDINNLKIINNDIDSIKGICTESSKVSIKQIENTINTYTNSLITTTNDKNRSSDINTIDYYVVEKGNSLAEKTKNMATTISGLSGFWTKWEEATELSAKSKVFLGYTNDLWGNLPVCPNAKVDDTSKDLRDDAIKLQENASNEASKEIEGMFKKIESDKKFIEDSKEITKKATEEYNKVIEILNKKSYSDSDLVKIESVLAYFKNAESKSLTKDDKDYISFVRSKLELEYSKL